ILVAGRVRAAPAAGHPLPRGVRRMRSRRSGREASGPPLRVLLPQRGLTANAALSARLRAAIACRGALATSRAALTMTGEDVAANLLDRQILGRLAGSKRFLEPGRRSSASGPLATLLVAISNCA